MAWMNVEHLTWRMAAESCVERSQNDGGVITVPIPPSPPCIWITHHMTYLRVLGLKITAGSKKASLRVLT